MKLHGRWDVYAIAFIMAAVVSGYAISLNFKTLIFIFCGLAVNFLVFKPLIAFYLLIFLFPIMPRELDFEIAGISLKMPDFIAFIVIISFISLFLLRKRRIPSSPITKMLIFYLTTLVISLVYNYAFSFEEIVKLRFIHREGSLGLNSPMVRGIKSFFWACYSFGIYLAVISFIRDRKILIRVTKILLFATVISSLVGIVYMGKYLLGFGEGIGLRVTRGIPQAKGTFREPSYFGEYLAMLLPLTLSLYLRPSLAFSRTFIKVSLFLLITALVLTFSSTGYGTAAVGVLILFILFLLQKQAIKLKELISLFLLLLISLTALSPLYPDNIIERVTYTVTRPLTVADGSVQVRTRTFIIGLRLFLDNPLLGIGPGNSPLYVFESSLENRFLPDAEAFATPGVLIQNLAEGGIIGMVAFLSTFIALFVHLFRSSRITNDPFLKSLFVGFIGLFAAMLTSFYANPNFYRPYLWGIMGIAAAAINIARDERTVW